MAEKKMCFLVGITGGSASGKSTFAQKVLEILSELKCGVLSQDHYYIDQSKNFKGDGQNINFDHPNALDWNLMALHLQELKKFKSIEVPQYDFATHQRKREVEKFHPKKIILVDGTLILSQSTTKDLFDKTIYMDAPEKMRFDRRLIRDTQTRGRAPEGVKAQFFHQVKPMHDLYIEPVKKQVHEVINGAGFDLNWLKKWTNELENEIQNS